MQPRDRLIETVHLVLFGGPPAPFSPWTPSPFVLDGVPYHSAAQFVLAEKARRCGDAACRARILGSTDPAEQRRLGRAVRNFDASRWRAERSSLMVRGNLARFGQRPPLCDLLLGTGEKELASAISDDPVWSIGLGLDDARARDRAHWRGDNLLGRALMEVRARLRWERDAAPSRRAWDANAAAWVEHGARLDRAQRGLDRVLLDAAAVEPGQRVLDAGCGTGGFARCAAEWVGVGAGAGVGAGMVVGVDVAPAMVDHARLADRDAAVRWAVADVEALAAGSAQAALVPASFDAVVCRFVLPLLADPRAAAAALATLLRPGGRLAVAVWATPEEAPLFGGPARLWAETDGAAADDPHRPGPFRLARPGLCAAALRAAGLCAVDEWTERVAVPFEDDADYADTIVELSGSTRARFAAAEPARRAAWRQRLRAVAAAHRDAAGAVVMPNTVRVVVGRRPAQAKSQVLR